MGDPARKPAPFDPDAFVERLVKEGRYVASEALVPSMRREWRVLKLELIDPKTPLWFDPPKGVCVITTETGERRIKE